MKRNSVVLLTLLMLLPALVFTSCSRKKDKVKTYVQAVNYEHQRVINRLDALERALESYVPSIMDKTYQEVFIQLDSSEKVINALKPLKTEENLRDDAMLLFDTYRLLLENEYSEIIRRQKKSAGTFTVADEFLVTNMGKHIAVNRKKAKEKFEREAALVLAKYKIPFEPVKEEAAEVSSSKTPEQGSRGR